jgi:hypothetical protein
MRQNKTQIPIWKLSQVFLPLDLFSASSSECSYRKCKLRMTLSLKPSNGSPWTAVPIPDLKQGIGLVMAQPLSTAPASSPHPSYLYLHRSCPVALQSLRSSCHFTPPWFSLCCFLCLEHHYPIFFTWVTWIHPLKLSLAVIISHISLYSTKWS